MTARSRKILLVDADRDSLAICSALFNKPTQPFRLIALAESLTAAQAGTIPGIEA